MSRVLTWGAGYSPRASAEASTGDVEHLGKLGSVVWFVAVWTAVNWSIASTTFMASAPFNTRLGLGLGFALAGLGFVLVFDRTMLFVLDTRLGRSFSWLWLIFRVVLILAVGTVTTERILPIILHAELQHQALIEREASETTRHAALAGRFQLAELGRRADSTVAEVRRLDAESRVVPAPIRASLSQAENCRRSVAAERLRLRRQGFGRQQASQRLAGRAAVCQRIGREAQAALAAFHRDMAARVVEARERAANSGADHRAAATAVDGLLSEAREIEAGSIVPTSSIVLGRLIASNPAAAVTVAVILIVMLAIELLPFVLKSFAGRTALGTRLAAERAIASLEPLTRLKAKEHEAEVAVASSAEVAAAMTEALRSEEVRAFMRGQAVAQARQVAPLVAALQTLREAEQSKREFDTIIARTPEMAAMGYTLWTRAVREMGGGPFA